MELLSDLHPFFVHFPIAMFICYALFDISGIILKKDYLEKGAHLLLIFSVIGALAAVLTGNQAKEVLGFIINKGALIPGGLIESHETFATITLWYFFFMLMIRTYLVVKKKYAGKIKYIFILLAVAGCVLVLTTAYLGGKLVYVHGAGTEFLHQSLN